MFLAGQLGMKADRRKERDLTEAVEEHRTAEKKQQDKGCFLQWSVGVSK